jgi:hypothetical protein
MLDRLLERTAGISLSTQAHGPDGDRDSDYEASSIIRGLVKVHLVLRAQ